MLNEDGVAGEVAMDDGRFTGVQVAGEAKTSAQSTFSCIKSHFLGFKRCFLFNHLRADRICVHQRFQAC